MPPTIDIGRIMQRSKLAAVFLSAIAAGVIAARAHDETFNANKEMVPDIEVLQSTYDLEVNSGNELHDRNLKIIEANCKKFDPLTYRCFVSFISRADPDMRLYYDVAEISNTGTGWNLTSGLCKRRDGPHKT